MKKISYEIPNKSSFIAMNLRQRVYQILEWRTEKEKDGKEIDYNSCLNALRWNALKNDFNIFPDEVNTVDEYKDLEKKIIDAYDNKEPLIRRNCRDCGEPFVIFISERDYYLSQKLILPKRCKPCREKRIRAKAVANGWV